ncbi:SCAR5 protein, partial [Polyodon spathula]|nr:SCAR5 protein [Polyodon spathula]
METKAMYLSSCEERENVSFNEEGFDGINSRSLSKLNLCEESPANRRRKTDNCCAHLNSLSSINNSPHSSGDAKVQWMSSDAMAKPASSFTSKMSVSWWTASPTVVLSELTGRLASRVLCSDEKKQSLPVLPHQPMGSSKPMWRFLMNPQ